MSEGTDAATLQEAAKAASCSSYQTQACTRYSYECAAGDVRTGSACTSISRITGNSCSGASVGGSGGAGAGGGSGGGGGWRGGGAPIPLSPACVTTCKGPHCRCQPSP